MLSRIFLIFTFILVYSVNYPLAATGPVTKQVVLDHADITMVIITNMNNQVILDFPEIPNIVASGSDEYRVFSSRDTNIVVIKPMKPVESNLFIKLKDYSIVLRLTVSDAADGFIDKYKFLYPSQTMKAMVDEQVNKKVEPYEKDYINKMGKLYEIADAKAQEILAMDVLMRSETRKLLLSDRKGQVRLASEALTKIGNKSFLKFKISNMSKRDYKIYKIVLALEERTGVIFKTTIKSNEVNAKYSFSNENMVIEKGKDFYGVVGFDITGVDRDKGQRLTLYVYEGDGDRNLKVSLLKL